MRWALRDDGRAGFLFLNNYQPVSPLPDRKAVQFLLHRPGGDQLVPAEPLDIPSGTYCILPLNLQVGGLLLRYATVDPLGSLSLGKDTWYVFGEIAGLRPELAIDRAELPRLQPAPAGAHPSADGSLAILPLTPSLGLATSFTSPSGDRIHLVVLPAREAGRLHRVNLHGAPALALSPATLHADGDRLVLESLDAAELSLAVFSPALQAPVTAGAPLFREVPLNRIGGTARPVVLTSLKPASPAAGVTLDGRREQDWDQAAEWRLSLPKGLAQKGAFVLQLSYQGEAARVLVEGKLHLDNYFNGDAMELPLWRIPEASLADLRLRVIPFAPDVRSRLPAAVAAGLPAVAVPPSALLVPVQHAEARF